MTHTVKWIDAGCEPKCAPDPAYPNGKDIAFPYLDIKTCVVNLPYPAKRCGHYLVHCSMCGIQVMITTAGRPDDPKSVQISCKETLQ